MADTIVKTIGRGSAVDLSIPWNSAVVREKSWKPAFYIFWGGQAVSLLGSSLVQFSLIWWLALKTGSASTMATAAMMGLLPSLILGPIAGVFVDRWSRKHVIIVSDGLIALSTAVLSLLFVLGRVESWHVYAILACRSIGGAFHGPAAIASTPLLVPKDALTRVAAMNRTMGGIVQFVAPALGAILLKALQVEGVLYIDIGTAAIAIISTLIITIPGPRVSAEAESSQTSVLSNLRAGFRYVWKSRGLRLMFITSAMYGFIVMPPATFVPILVTQYFGRGAFHLGLMQSVLGISMIGGGMVLMVWGGFKSRILTSVFGTTGIAVGELLIVLASPEMYWLALAGIALIGVAVSIHTSPLQAMYQEVVPSHLQGRFFGLSHATFSAMGPVSFAVTGPLADSIGVRPIYLLGCIGTLAIVALRAFVPAIRHIESDSANVTL